MKSLEGVSVDRRRRWRQGWQQQKPPKHYGIFDCDKDIPPDTERDYKFALG